MKYILAFLLAWYSANSFAQAPPIRQGATVYIEPMNGYETYLAAAILKKQVPLSVVAEKGKADYIITSTVSHQVPGQPSVVVNNTNASNGGNDAFQNGLKMGEARRAARGVTDASMVIADSQSSQIVFAYSVGKSGNTNQFQSAAEAFAKHLKEFIVKSNR